MNVLVTGGTGIIGVNVVRQLIERGDLVTVFDRKTDSGFLRDLVNDYAHVPGDLLDLPWLIETIQEHRIDRIVHLGAVMAPHHATHPHMMSKINLEGTLNVFEAAKLCGVPRVIFGSTRGVIARTDGTEYGHPSYKPVPASFSGPRLPLTILKHAAEELGLCYARNGFFEFCAIRFADFYGAERVIKPERSQANVFNDVILAACRGQSMSLAGGDQMFDPIYIRDCGAGVVAACTVETLPAKVYQLGGGRGVRFADAVETVRGIFPKARIELEGGFNFARAEKDPNYCVLDIEDARRDLGFEPTFDLAAGLKDFVAVLQRFETTGAQPGKSAIA
ncbi:NAD(P)-dependent oxidoreductase [Marivibrio halodurans]|uniref:NAD(P)-dependent oxidoreductase n=1 Tax=Marivibrio halodurans TaxID=2039722 RepID=A0A8J7S2K5_9PROT|nr:NAD(P)-dependent oxidoreductase [Marivibrio halodurans]MBP5857474.1 NAD(P)-dependent oxidoreductase [Marivibrio halodurans]